MAREWSQGGVAGRLYVLLMASFVVAGIVMRTRGVLSFTFWLDECSWASFLMEKPLEELLIRPIGFMASSKALASLFGASVGVLRAIPWTAGVATVLLSPFLAERLFAGRAARLLFVGALATNSEAVNYAKEFKPYALGLSLHCAVLFLVLRYFETPRAKTLLVALVVAVAAVLFTQDMVFAYPGTLLALTTFAWKRGRRRELAAIVVAGATALSLVVVQYVLIWSKIGGGESAYWGDRYDVFFTAKHGGSHLSWFVEKYLDTVSFPSVTRLEWQSSFLSREALARLASAYEWCFIGLHAAGVAFLIRTRRGRLALLLITPIVTMAALNWVGMWPFGAFRTNLFSATYSTALAALALDWPLHSAGALARLRDARASAAAGFAPALVLVVAPVILFYDGWTHIAHGAARAVRMPEIVAELVRLQGPGAPPRPEPLILDGMHCDAWNYYTKYNPGVVARFGPELARRFDAECCDTDRAAVRALEKVASGDRVFNLFVPQFVRRSPAYHRMLARRFEVEKRDSVEASTAVVARRLP